VTAQLYYAVGARFGFDWLRDRTQALVADNGWQRLAIATVIDDLYAQQTDVTRQVARAMPPKAPPAAAIETWFSKNGHAGDVGRIESLLSELKAANAVDLSMLLVANREIRGLLGH
jgi:glutamate dehydrogenase